MANIHDAADKRKTLVMIYRSTLMVIFCLGLFTLSTSFIFLSSLPQLSFAQLASSSSPEMDLTQGEGAENQPTELEAAREQYLSVWNNTTFTSQFDVFVAEGTVGLYGEYREHVPANVFRPGETIELYVEPVGFGHQPITDTSVEELGNTDAAPRTLYLINMSADIIGTDSGGAQVFAIEDLPVAVNLVSHRQMTEIPMTLTLSQEEPFPVGDYIITYVVHDQVTGQSFQIDKTITIDEDAVTGAAPLPEISNDSSLQEFQPQQQQQLAN
jgi:hypothetical protein